MQLIRCPSVPLPPVQLICCPSVPLHQCAVAPSVPLHQCAVAPSAAAPLHRCSSSVAPVQLIHHSTCCASAAHANRTLQVQLDGQQLQWAAAWECTEESAKNHTCHERLNWTSVLPDLDKLTNATRATDPSAKTCFVDMQLSTSGIRTYIYQGYPVIVPGLCTPTDRATILNSTVASICVLGDANTSCVFNWSDREACGGLE